MAAHQNNFWASCSLGELNVTRELLLTGADPNTRGGGGYDYTCLMMATNGNEEEVVDLLLAQPNIEVNAKDNDKNSTALHFACRTRTRNIAIFGKLLAVPGILVNERDNNGWTPIMWAITYGKPEAIRMMAAVEDVDLDVRSYDGRSLEDLAHRWAGEAAVGILGEERQRREESKRLVREQKKRVGKVLLEGIYDEDSPLHKLRSPNDVVNVAMPIVWEHLTWDWQVGLNFWSSHSILLS